MTATEKRLIDANVLKAKAFPEYMSGEGMVFVQDIDETPTVDAVEVVRCKDCKHYHPMKPYPSYNGHTNYCCRCATVKVGDNDFCSYGERRDDHA